jgi:hypothetical protein
LLQQHQQQQQERRRRASYYGYDPRRRYADLVDDEEDEEEDDEDEEDEDEDDYDDEDDDEEYGVEAAARSLEGLNLRGGNSRVSSDPGAPGKSSGIVHEVATDAGGGKARAGKASAPPPSNASANPNPADDGGFTMRFTPNAALKLDFTGGFEGRTVSLKPGQDGEQAEISIGSRKSVYAPSAAERPATTVPLAPIAPAPPAPPPPPAAEHIRSGGRRRDARDAEAYYAAAAAAAAAGHPRSATHSRRSSRVPLSRRQPNP